MFNWIGFTFLEAQLPRESNEELLNNLKEGVFIVGEEDNEIQFENAAAKRLNYRLGALSNISLYKDNCLVNDSLYQQFDYRNLKNGDYDSAIRFLEQGQDNDVLNM